MRTILQSFIGLAIVSLAACSTPIVQNPPTKEEPAQSTSQRSSKSSTTSSLSSESQSLPPDMRETKNVTYRGIVQPSGISIYMQGTHRLALSDGRFILLESENIDLNGYVGEEVDISGAIRPTVEAGGQIMRVEEAELIIKEESSSSPLSENEASEDNVETTGQEEAVKTFSSSSPTMQKPFSSSSIAPKPSSASSSSSSSSSEEAQTSSTSPEMEAVIAAMAKEDFTAENWTQEYCSGHIGFCFPVHRNWWYKSFGATTNFLWHLEVSNAPVLNLGDGPIVINLVRGPLPGADLSVNVEGNTALGLHQWTANQHFEISADKRLQAAITYIVKNLKTYEGE